MRDRNGETLFQTWQSEWKPRVSRLQLAVTLGVTALALGSIALHWLLVVAPGRDADLVRLELPYKPWYLTERPAAQVKAVGAESPPEATGKTEAERMETVRKLPVLSMPNLVPQSGNWDAGRLEQSVLAYLDRKRQSNGGKPYEPSGETNAVARELAERYASGGPEAIKGRYENTLLSGGWLWEVWRGCEATVYLSFPDSRIEEMGCSPGILPSGSALGVGVATWQGPGGRTIPVFALVWHSAGMNGGVR